ncbi:MAG: diguanylate cyclase [Deltaproteobacteria bacterium]|nr:diguanylate cyclase [Deltaproteobacteria bacterium]
MSRGPSTSGSVLVVEDDALLRRVIQYTLADAGFEVALAGDGVAALKIIEEGRHFDLIVSDINMPRMSGFELRKHLLDSRQSALTPFIFLSARNSPEDQVQGLSSRVDDYVTKPFEPVVLLARVQAVLERRRVLDTAARTDPLTGLLNRRALEEEIERSLLRLGRHDEQGCMVFLDIDHFKLINDQWGHSAGDEVLRRLATLLSRSTREVDVVGRYGGEEFLLYLEDSAPDGAMDKLQRMQRDFGELRVDGIDRVLSFSAGVAVAPVHGSNFEQLCRRADEAMYQAKQDGRQCVRIWDETNS